MLLATWQEQPGASMNPARPNDAGSPLDHLANGPQVSSSSSAVTLPSASAMFAFRSRFSGVEPRT